MKNTTLLHSQEQIIFITKRLVIAVDSGKKHEVIIRESSGNRSLAQNALYWKWMGIAGQDMGWEPDELHDEMRVLFLSKIFEENPERHPALIETLGNLRIVARSDRALGVTLHRQYILGAVSTTDASVKEFTAYLNRIDKHCAENGIVLPLPADIGLDEMAWKR